MEPLEFIFIIKINNIVWYCSDVLKCEQQKNQAKVTILLQGKEIVKIKQENKALREASVGNGDAGGSKTFPM